MTHIKFVDGKGGVIANLNANTVPMAGEYVQLPNDQQYLVTRVMIVYLTFPRDIDWAMVTVTPT